MCKRDIRRKIEWMKQTKQPKSRKRYSYAKKEFTVTHIFTVTKIYEQNIFKAEHLWMEIDW